MNALKKENLEYTKCIETGRRFKTTSFPNSCSCCKKSFESREQYWKDTHKLIKGDYSEGEEDSIFEYRNCNDCESTIICEMAEERDNSPEGQIKRESWNKQMEFLVKNGIELDRAKKILKYRNK